MGHQDADVFKVVEDGEVSSKEGDDALFNVEIKAASIFKKYTDLLNFEDVSEGVLGRCAGVLHDNCSTVDLCKFLSSNMDNQEVVVSLMNKELRNILLF